MRRQSATTITFQYLSQDFSDQLAGWAACSWQVVLSGHDHVPAVHILSSSVLPIQGKMKIISKIECLDALEHLDEIISASDYLLLDRGDLSKEIPIEKIPLAQKIILAYVK